MKIIDRLRRIKDHLLINGKDKHSRRGYVKLLSRLRKTIGKKMINRVI